MLLLLLDLDNTLIDRGPGWPAREASSLTQAAEAVLADG